MARELDAPAKLAKHFFGDRFNLDDVRSFKPDVTIDHSTELKIGGTRIELIPVRVEKRRMRCSSNCQTRGHVRRRFHHALPRCAFRRGGQPAGLFDAIDIIVEKKPKYLLHGHEPLTQTFASPAMLAQLKTDLIRLREQVLSAIRRGDKNAVIQQANLIPPDCSPTVPPRTCPICSCANMLLTVFMTRMSAIGRRTLRESYILSSDGEHVRILVDCTSVSIGEQTPLC